MIAFSVVGLGLSVIYTAIGIASLPCHLIRGTNETVNTLSQVELEITEAETRLSELRINEEALNSFEQDEANRLEQEISAMNRRKNELIESSRGCYLLCYRMFRPFQVICGLIFLSFYLIQQIFSVLEI